MNKRIRLKKALSLIDKLKQDIFILKVYNKEYLAKKRELENKLNKVTQKYNNLKNKKHE